VGFVQPDGTATNKRPFTKLHDIPVDKPSGAEGNFAGLKVNLIGCPAMAADLVSRKVTVIVAGGSVVGVRAVITATQSIPIVFTTATDQVATGLVASLSRPGGNVTGITFLGSQLVPKLLDFCTK
jgi:hypothetical protein